MKTWKGARADRVFVAIIFFILGMGTLLPWNFFITAMGYFKLRLNKNVTSNSSDLVDNDPYKFSSSMTVISQLPLLLFTLLNSFLYPRIPERVRIAGSLVAVFLLFVLTAILVKVPMDEDNFFSITMATIWFINSFGAVLQGSLFGLVGKFPHQFSSLFMSGQAVAGIFAALAMVLSISCQAEADTAALGYFITPCMATLLTILCYFILPHLEFARHHLEKSQSGPDLEALKTKEILVEGPAEERSTVLAVFKKIWVMALCVTCVFAVTLSVFPAVTVNVKTTFKGGEWEKYFTPVCCFLVFNVMDWIGRSATSVVQWPSKESRRLFPVLVAARVIFIPLLALCNIEERKYLPVFFSHDVAYAAIMSLFALTNGYCACLCFSYAPQLVRSKDAETAGALMTFFLAVGLSLGAAFSFALTALV